MSDIVIVRRRAHRYILIAAIASIAAIVTLLAIRWQVGNMLASLTSPDDPGASDLAATAVRWAPGDPLAAWLAARTAPDPDITVEHLENALRLAPHDHRLRIELGRALEQVGQIARAEAELRRAADLAPTYAYPRWHLGNFYLRQERVDEAMAELKMAAADNQFYREQVFSLAWDYFDKDPARLEALAGDTAEGRSRLAYFFAARGWAADALRNWNRLSEDAKSRRGALARSIAHGLFSQRKFPEALEFSRQVGFDPESKPETVTDGSFELGPDASDDARFGWNSIRNDPRLEVAGDTRVRRDGQRSLRVTFKSYSRATLANVFQTVVVTPGSRYRLRFWIKTENLKSAGLPQVEVANLNDDQSLARSPVFPAGTSDWQELSVEFIAPQNCTGISIRTVRAYCGDDCPLSGTLWYEDFELVKL
jgi:hypothetical protein